MKIWCDVCSKNKASIFCSADEAALCDDCDPRVHHANKLASKHQRLSLLQPSSTHAPLCDICQEKKALLFCQQDRAILCIDCDGPIHAANELTQKHDRFLLTGVKLSALSTTTTATATVSATASTTTTTNTRKSTVPDPKPQNLTTKMLNFKAQPTAATVNMAGGGGSTSSISEYLTEMLPGWQVEDLLDSSLDFDGFSKGSENDLLFLDTDLVSRANSYDSMGLWVPQAPPLLQPSVYNSGFYGVDGFEGEDMSRNVSRKRMDDGFTVPEISHQSKDKKFRAFC